MHRSAASAARKRIANRRMSISFEGRLTSPPEGRETYPFELLLIAVTLLAPFTSDLAKPLRSTLQDHDRHDRTPDRDHDDQSHACEDEPQDDLLHCVRGHSVSPSSLLPPIHPRTFKRGRTATFRNSG